MYLKMSLRSGWEIVTFITSQNILVKKPFCCLATSKIFNAHIEILMNVDMCLGTENCVVPSIDVNVVTTIEHVQYSEEPRFGFEIDK